MNVRTKLGDRLKLVEKNIKGKRFEDAYNEYKVLVSLFNRLHGYDEGERGGFFREIKLTGDKLIIGLLREKIKEEEKVDLNDFRDILDREVKANTGFEDVARLIDVELYEEALKKYEKRS